MNERIKSAFEAVYADETLRRETEKRVVHSLNEGAREKRFARRRIMVAFAACLLMIFVGWSGYRLYFIPQISISIDINPSMELGINRFDKVISVRGYNEDGQELANSLELRFMDYDEAIKEILGNPDIATLLSKDEIVTIAVVGTDQKRCEEMLASVRACTADQENAYCYAANRQQLEQAHELGLSYGKYRAFQQLRALDPSITKDDVGKMTMREIRDRIAELSSDATDGLSLPNGSGNGKGRNRNGNGRAAQPLP